MRKVWVLVAVVAAPLAARADVTRCGSADADLRYMASDLADEAGDTGWFPSDSAAQLRLTGRMTGQTTVAMGLTPTACWDKGMMLTAPARTRTGLFDAEYGAELHVFGQIHTSVLGQAIDWEGEIPIPFLPTDLLVADTTGFDGTLLPDAAVSSASASDTTSRIPVLITDLIGDLIDIVGISGGLTVYVQGEMTSTYATGSIALGDGTITQTGGSVTVATPDGGFGPSLTIPTSATGDVLYQPGLVFTVAFVVRILGISVASIDLASVELPLAPTDRSITLSADAVTIPLPHLATVPTSLGFATGATQQLHLHNAGLAPLMIELADPSQAATVAPVTIAPGADGVVVVTATDPANLASLVLASNDPNHETLTIAVDPTMTGQTDGGGADDTSHAGCQAGGGSLGLVLVALCGLVTRRRRSA